jgi:multidrug efflux pump subunit AcrB
MDDQMGFAGRLARSFIDSKLTPLIVAASVLLGIGAVLMLPREEEPQIIVPMIDIFVEMPGASAREVAERVTKPMEKLLWEIPGVEYIYSTSSPGLAMAIVRFYVGEREEDAIVRLNQKMFANFDLIPPGASPPLVKPRSIDDVPILALTLWSDRQDHYLLRRVAAQLHDEIKRVEDVSEVTIIGGQRRQVRVLPDVGRLEAFRVSPARLSQMLAQSNRQLQAGSFSLENREFLVETGSFLRTAEDVASLVVAVHEGKPVYLRDVARIQDGPEELSNYVLYGKGPAARHSHVMGTTAPSLDSGSGVVGDLVPAVTIAVAKRKGTNAIVLADRVIEKVDGLRGHLIPDDIQLTVTRNYGETAQEKSNELLFHMFLAIISVSILIWLTLGLRESGIVAIAIPVTLALTLVVFYFLGYTLNRVTLFALIFSIGILVDDAIVVVENIVRHYRMPQNRERSVMRVAIEAVDEVGNPTILATFAVIAAILPMAFVSGLMGPYMRPIPVGASAAMLFSLLIAFIVTPWASLRLLRRKQFVAGHGGHGEVEGWSTRMYRVVMGRMISVRWMRFAFLGGVVILLLAAVALFPLKRVTVKMLPFDNKSEFQIIIDMPEGSTLEQTAAATHEIGMHLATVPEVTDYQLYVGTASPHNFNGLVRHYFLRREPFQADIQVNLAPKGYRKEQSHDIAKRVRPGVQEIARRHGANVKVAEVPPGPPVLQTLVAEIYGPDYQRQIEVAGEVQRILEETPGVVDVDSYVEADQEKLRFEIDQEKAALNGVSVEQIATTVRLAVQGLTVGLLHVPSEKEDVAIHVRLPLETRSSIRDLESLRVQGDRGNLVPLGELVRIERVVEDKSIYHKNLMPVVYVTGDVAGTEESPVYAILELTKAVAALEIPEGYEIEQYTATQPFTSERLALKWDGEWHITYEVFGTWGSPSPSSCC